MSEGGGHSGEATAERPWPKPGAAWYAVAIFSLAAVLSYTDRQILSLLVDPIRGALAITDTQVGLLQGIAFALIYSIAGLPLGRAADIFPRRAVIIAGITLWSIATVACGYAHSFTELFIARVFVGIGEACLAPAAMSMIGDYFPAQKRGTAVGTFLLGMVVGGGVALMIGGSVLQAVQHGLVANIPWLSGLAAWRAVLVLMALPGALLVLLMLTVREPERQLHAMQEGSHTLPLREVLRDFAQFRGLLLPLYLGMALMSVGDFGMSNWIPALLSRRYAMDPTQIGGLFGGAQIVGAAIGVFGGGFIADRWVARVGSRGRFVVAFAAATLAMPGAFAGVTGSADMVIAGYTWWTLMSSAAAAVGLTALQDVVPNHMRGIAIALASFGNIMLGFGGGTTLTAWVNDHVFHHPLAIGSSMTLVSLPACLLAMVYFWRGWRVTRLATSLGT
ncbi:MFS transporter [Rhodanobacter sp. Col0626]|uniref:MFS transporter n=1 Tax=Rhodanobacter sp. Col0626 TaxID=3415679 RepID=UPI003CEF2560